MIFCATMGAALLYWAVLEWVYYYITPPQSITPESIAAAQVAVSYNFFHWGVPAWGIYAIGTIPLAYRFYVRRQVLPAAGQSGIRSLTLFLFLESFQVLF